MTGKTLYCSFCGKPQHEVAKLIAGPTVFVCDECVYLCACIIGDQATDPMPDAVTLERPVPHPPKPRPPEWAAPSADQLTMKVDAFLRMRNKIAGQITEAIELLGDLGVDKATVRRRLSPEAQDAFDELTCEKPARDTTPRFSG